MSYIFSLKTNYGFNINTESRQSTDSKIQRDENFLKIPEIPSPIKRKISQLKDLRAEQEQLEVNIKRSLEEYLSVDQRVDQVIEKILNSPNKKIKIEEPIVASDKKDVATDEEEDLETDDQYEIIYVNKRELAAREKLREKIMGTYVEPSIESSDETISFEPSSQTKGSQSEVDQEVAHSNGDMLQPSSHDDLFDVSPFAHHTCQVKKTFIQEPLKAESTRSQAVTRADLKGFKVTLFDKQTQDAVSPSNQPTRIQPTRNLVNSSDDTQALV